MILSRLSNIRALMIFSLVGMALLIACKSRDGQENKQENVLVHSERFRLIALGQALIEHDLRKHSDFAVKQAAEYLKAADVCFSNLEVAITGKSAAERTREWLYFHAAQPEVLDCLKEMGINMLALSNNHSWDLGTNGILLTIEEVEKRGFTHAGTGITIKEASAPSYLDTSKSTVALVAMASGSLKADAAATEKRPGVNELRLEENGVWNQEDRQKNLNSISEAGKVAA